ncbi:lysophospholipase-like protein [Calycina marina]|uniref:Lysophospholipase-like protein n=1 Tax=Calycina marina TaxID=1763456 RepID=A0A9P7ZAG3_9HELO|nr:lysophospholipase-like protein [Calycina marina]
MTTELEGKHQIGDVSLYTKTWKPSGPPKAKLVFIHGFNDHINRYYETFPTLASHGIETLAFDQRGWGRSVKSPSDKGKTGPTSLVISDIVSVIKTQLPSPVPLFLLGHSMGGGEVITLASDPLYSDLTPQIRGWMLESPFVDFTPESKPAALKVILGRLAGRLMPYRQMVNPIPPEHTTRDPEVIKSLYADKLIHDTGTLEGLAGMLDRTAAINTGKAKLNPGTKSIWLGHGTADQGTSYAASKQWFEEQTGVQDKEFKTYEGWAHQLHADTPETRLVYMKDITDWILARVEDESNVKPVEAKL